MTRWSARGLEARVGSFALGPVDLEVGDAETVAIVGRSGAGKTTLLRTLAGLVAASAGSVVRDDLDVGRLPPELRGVGYVPQGLGLFPHRSVEGNVRYPLQIRGDAEEARRARELIEKFGLSALAGRRIHQLSTGEQHRVAIARALAANPRLLLWDEPLVSLDVASRDDLLETLQVAQATERTPIVLVSHDAPTAFTLASRFVVLDAGRVVYRGDATGFVRQPVDPFVARFLGYENVYAREALEARPGSAWARWLKARAGPLGVCFTGRDVRPFAEGPSTYGARVRRVEPVPGGLIALADVDGLPLEFRWEGPELRLSLIAGSIVPFAVDERSLKPLGEGRLAFEGPQ